MKGMILLQIAVVSLLLGEATANSKKLPWAPPPADSPELLSHLRDTSRPKLAYSTYIAWYEDGGMNESALLRETEFMSKRLREHGWTHVLHDYGWQVCGSTYNLTPISKPGKLGCYHTDQYGRLLPDPQRYPSTASDGSWKPIVDKVHDLGMAFGLHLIHGVPITAAQKKLPVLGTNYTMDELVYSKDYSFIADHWIINASHPGAQAYYDSVVSMWADAGLDFVYLDGVEGSDAGCQIGAVSLISNAMKRLGNGMFLYTSFGPPIGNECSFEELSELAPYVRVGGDTVDAWDYDMQMSFSPWTREVAPLIKPHHFGDLAGMWIGEVHCPLGTPGCVAGPDYFVPSNRSALTKDEVMSDINLNAIFRSSWWHAGAFSYSNDWDLSLMTNDDVIRITMMSTNTRQVMTSISTPAESWGGPGIVWTGDDTVEDWKYVLLVNMCPCDPSLQCNPACPATFTELPVDVDFLALGLTPATSCDVTEMWENKSLGRAYSKLHSSLRAHASLLVKLSNCTGPASVIV